MIQPKLPFAPETARVDEVDKAIQDAIDAGREVLTPRGVMHLFGLSEAAVRKARLKDKSGVRFVLSVTDRPVSMLSLDWALKQWGPPDADGEKAPKEAPKDEEQPAYVQFRRGVLFDLAPKTNCLGRT